MDCSLPGSSVHGILQAGVLEWGAIAFSVIFLQTRRNAKWLTVEMMQDGHQVSLLSGELTVDQRASIIQRFRDGKEKVLITTNVCARGVCVCIKEVIIYM